MPDGARFPGVLVLVFVFGHRTWLLHMYQAIVSWLILPVPPLALEYSFSKVALHPTVNLILTLPYVPPLVGCSRQWWILRTGHSVV